MNWLDLKSNFNSRNNSLENFPSCWQYTVIRVIPLGRTFRPILSVFICYRNPIWFFSIGERCFTMSTAIRPADYPIRFHKSGKPFTFIVCCLDLMNFHEKMNLPWKWVKSGECEAHSRDDPLPTVFISVESFGSGNRGQCIQSVEEHHRAGTKLSPECYMLY